MSDFFDRSFLHRRDPEEKISSLFAEYAMKLAGATSLARSLFSSDASHASVRTSETVSSLQFETSARWAARSRCERWSAISVNWKSSVVSSDDGGRPGVVAVHGIDLSDGCLDIDGGEGLERRLLDGCLVLRLAK